MMTNADTAYGAGNITDMHTYTSLLDTYNNSGDTIVIGNAGNATPKTSQNLASITFWDNP